MGWILMQPANNDESVAAAIHLNTTGNCLFDFSVGGNCLKIISFGSRGCNDNEKTFIFLPEREHAVNGLSLKIGNTYEAVIFIGSVTVPP